MRDDHLLCHVSDIVEPNSKLPDIYLDYVSALGYRFQQKIKLPVKTQRRLGTLDIARFITYFTGGGFANPAHTLLALALRLADHLQRGIVS